jgi:hypothetical protein
VAKKKKHDYRSRQISSFWTEISQITLKLAVETKKPSLSDAIDPVWLKDCSEHIKESYNFWKKECFEKYGKDFTDASRLLLGIPLRNIGAWELISKPNQEVSIAIYLDLLCQELEDSFEDYKDRLIKASEKDKRSNFTTIISEVLSGGESPQNLKKEFHYTIPSLIVEYLHLSPKAAKLPRTSASLATLLSFETLQNKNTREKFAEAMTHLYVYLVYDFCKRIKIERQYFKREFQDRFFKDPNSQYGQTTKAIYPEDLIKHQNPGFAVIQNTLKMSQEETDKRLKKCIEHFEALDNLYYLFGAVPALGISQRSLFWIYLAKFHSCYIYSRCEEKFFDEDSIYFNEKIIWSVARINTMIKDACLGELLELKQTVKTSGQIQKEADQRIAAAERKATDASKEAQAAQRELSIAKEEISRLAAEKEQMAEDIKALRRECKALEELLPPAEEGEEEADDPGEDKIVFPVRSNRKVVIYGGHATWAAPMRQRFPDCTFLYDRESYNYSAASTADIIIFQPNAISHSSYGSVKSIAEKSGITVHYFEKAGVENCSRQLYEILREIDALEIEPEK